MENSPTFVVGGRVKKVDAKPPYMIVATTIQSLIVTSGTWPSSLWRVCVTKLGDMSGLIENPGYWRAIEIELIEEIPTGMLFGIHGDKIIPLFNQIMSLTLAEVDTLYANYTNYSEAEVAYTRAWQYWNKNLKNPRSHTYEYGITIASPSRHDKEMSPNNHGFSLISDLIWRRAREIDGERAIVEYVEYDQTEIELNERWKAASAAFLYKAMELSMSQYLSVVECAALTHAWSSVFGRL